MAYDYTPTDINQRRALAVVVLVPTAAGAAVPAPVTVRGGAAAIGTVTLDSINFPVRYVSTSTISSSGGPPGAPGKANSEPIVLMKNVDATTPALWLAVALGTSFSKAVITIGQNVEIVTLKDVRVADDQQVAGDTANPAPSELVTLSFAETEFQVGTNRAGFNFASGKKT